MTKLEEEIQRLRMDSEHWYSQALEKDGLIRQMQMSHESAMEEATKKYTEDTRVLRQKVAVLTEKLDNATTATVTTTLNDFTSDMDNLTMGEDWQGMFAEHFDADSNAAPVAPTENSIVVAHRSKDLVSEDKPVASGILLLLLLCGAFVASKSQGASGPALPKMPDEVRAASATVLDNILKDANAVDATVNGLAGSRIQELEPRASGSVWSQAQYSGMEFTALSAPADPLDQTYHGLTGLTKEQQEEQLFSITPAQYNSLTDTEYTRRGYSISGESGSPSDAMSPSSQPNHRRNIAETLANMREQSKAEGAAAVYTRSLLWDTIPTEVVREFKRMVEESDKLTKAEQQEDAMKSAL
jgi:hypothetical protein